MGITIPQGVTFKNTKLTVLKQELAARRRTDERDIVLIKAKEDRFRKLLLAQRKNEDDDNGVSGRLQATDQLMFILCLLSDTILAACHQSQQVNAKDDLDYEIFGKDEV